MDIHYVTGSRADFGLMKRLLLETRADPRHRVDVIVTSQHTNPKYGATARDVETSGLRIAHRIPVELSGESGAEMALAMSQEIAGFTRYWSDNRPDMVLLLGDRGEMLAGALAAMHLGIHIGHIGGGERSGTLDESFRHAISKLAHFHFVTTPQAAERLEKMGEPAQDIHLIGAPGLVALTHEPDRQWLERSFNIPADRKAALVVFHPVVQQAEKAAVQFQEVIDAVLSSGYSAIVLRPNSDAGGTEIDRALDKMAGRQNLCIVTHLERDEYCRTVASVDLMIGNSSSGIIESASLGTACVNVGIRQNGRERNANTVDCEDVLADSLKGAIRKAEKLEVDRSNIYGDGNAHEKFVRALGIVRLDADKLDKMNTY